MMHDKTPVSEKRTKIIVISDRVESGGPQPQLAQLLFELLFATAKKN